MVMKEQYIKIKKTLNEIMEMPYGREVGSHRKNLATNPFHYKRCVETLVDELIELKNKGANIMISQIQKIQSLIDNDINKLIVDNKNLNTSTLGEVNEEMERISLSIRGYVQCMLDIED